MGATSLGEEYNELHPRAFFPAQKPKPVVCVGPLIWLGPLEKARREREARRDTRERIAREAAAERERFFWFGRGLIRSTPKTYKRKPTRTPTKCADPRANVGAPLLGSPANTVFLWKLFLLSLPNARGAILVDAKRVIQWNQHNDHDTNGISATSTFRTLHDHSFRNRVCGLFYSYRSQCYTSVVIHRSVCP